MLASTQIRVEGNDSSGDRVKMVLPGYGVTLLVVKEAARYRVLDALGGSARPEFAAYEVSRVKQGRVAEARRSIAWIREEATKAGQDDPLQGPLISHFWDKRRVVSAWSLILFRS